MRINKNINRKDKNKCTTIFYWVSGISFLMSSIAFCYACVSRKVIIDDESIVLIFVGILATFVVVGNYAQVKSIEQDFSQKVGELKYEFDKKSQEQKNEFSEKIKELNRDFGKKVLLSQTLSIINELYKKMVDSVSKAEGLISEPYSSIKRKEMIEKGKDSKNAFISFLNINRLILPSEVFPLFKNIEELLSDWYNNSIYIPSTPENNNVAEEKIFGKLNKAVKKDIPEIQRKIDELIIKYLRNE